jgi:tRNA nucleotidyltransferase (CCA-adding enzyme)
MEKSWQTILASIIPSKKDDIKLKSCFDKIKLTLSDECKLGNVEKVGSYGKKTLIIIENKMSDIDLCYSWDYV